MATCTPPSTLPVPRPNSLTATPTPPVLGEGLVCSSRNLDGVKISRLKSISDDGDLSLGSEVESSITRVQGRIGSGLRHPFNNSTGCELSSLPLRLTNVRCLHSLSHLFGVSCFTPGLTRNETVGKNHQETTKVLKADLKTHMHWRSTNN